MRTDFFRDFVSQSGMTCGEISKLIGISLPGIYSWFDPNVDDVKLSHIRKVAKATGFRLRITMTKRDDLQNEPDPESEVVRKYVNGKLVEDPTAFINLFIQKYHIKKNELADKVGIAYTTLNYQLRNPDLLLSSILAIAEACDATVHFYFDKYTEKEDARIYSDIISKQRY